MARHKRFKGLGDALDERALKIEKKILKGIRQAAIAADQAAIFATPVDTGYVRSRWIVSLGAPITEVDGATVRSIDIGEEIAAAISASQGLKEIRKWRGQGSIFINNPVHYAFYLENGSSEQAPQGMLEEAVQAGLKILKELEVLEQQ